MKPNVIVGWGKWIFFGLCAGVFIPQAEAVDIVIIGDLALPLVQEVIAEIKASVHGDSTLVLSTSSVEGSLGKIVEEHHPRVVIALGREALQLAQSLPPQVTLLYGLVLAPPTFVRANMTGIYMAAPLHEYAELLERYIPSIKTVAVIGTREQWKAQGGSLRVGWKPYFAENAHDAVNALNRVEGVDAILLLPDATVLTRATLEGAYLHSFRKKRPLLGGSAKQVREGALLALVADLDGIGRSMGEYASRIVHGTPVEQLPETAPKTFQLFINITTAKTMGIRIPDECLKRAKEVYR